MDHKVLETDRHRYVVVSSLAEGGMGTVYLGRRVSAGAQQRGHGDSQAADVVLKQLNPEHTDDPKLIEMFVREARLSASLDHPNIVRALDLVNVGQDYFIVMEYVRGGDLRSLVRRAKRRQARLSIDSALFIITEVLAALSYAHSKRGHDGQPLGIIHRDVSPSNILLAADGEVKLTDFGIAKMPTQGSVVFKIKGKLGYMAPEQARGEPTDQRADLFAAGVVLYEMLADERLFLASAFASPAVIFSQPIRPPSRKRAELSPELDEIVLRSLALDPAKRFSTAQEMRAAILRSAERARRRLEPQALAADLRNVCGEDSSSWLSLDVPAGATLGGGDRGDGTGVILTDLDDEEVERSSVSRASLLPSKELTSIVELADPRAEPELGLAPTRIAPEAVLRPAPKLGGHRPGGDARLAFTRTDVALPIAEKPQPRPPGRGPLDHDDFETEDSGVRTRVQSGEMISARSSRLAPPFTPPPPTHAPSLLAARSSHPPARSSQPPTDSTTSAEARRRTSEPANRAVFEPPVPRPSPPPPSELEASRLIAIVEPTRLSHPTPVSAATSVSRPQASSIAPSSPTPPSGVTRRPERDVSTDQRLRAPSSLAAFEGGLERRPLTRILLGIALVIVLIGLGIGLGVLVSGGDPDEVPTADGPHKPSRAEPPMR